MERDTPAPEAGRRMTRRLVLGAGAGLIAARAAPVFGQGADDYRALALAIEEARRVRDFAVGIALAEIDFALIDFLKTDLDARRQTLALARETGRFANADAATAYLAGLPEALPDLVPLGFDPSGLAAQRTVVAMLAAEGVPLAPSPDLVTPASIPAIPAYAKPVAGRPDTDLIVAADILLETMGISIGDASLIVALIDSDPGLRAALEDLVARISSKDWQEVVELGEGVFKLFVASAAWAEIKRRAIRKLSWRLALKAVPVVGWLYCGAAFMVSVKKNYHRFSFA